MSHKLPPSTDDDRPLRAAAYVRVSTRGQVEEGYSLAEQQRRAEAYIASKGWHHVGTYVEAGVSGRRADRPKLSELLRELEEIDMLVVPALSRLGRSNRHLQELFAQLDAASVELVFLAENIDTSSASGKLLRNVLSSLAEFEGDLLAERVSGSMEARACTGLYPGGPPPYGRAYAGTNDKGRPTGALLVDPIEGPITARMIRECAEGKSLRSIARDLTREGLLTRKGRAWQPATVTKIVKNPVHAGQVHYRGETYKGQHEPTVDRDLWRQAQEMIASRSRTKGHRGGRSTRDPFLFVRGMLRCGSCGEAMVPRSDSGTYECLSRKRDVASCDQMPVRRELIDTRAWDFFQGVGIDLEATRAAVAEGIGRATAEVRVLREQAAAEVRKAEERLARVRRDYTDGNLAVADWYELTAELTAEQEAARAEADRLRAREGSIAEGADLLDAEETTLRKLAEVQASFASRIASSENVEVARAAVAQLFDRFTLHRLVDNGDGTCDWPRLDPAKGINPDMIAPGGYLIEQHPKPEAIEVAGSELLHPVLRRIPLALAGATDIDGLTT